VLRSKRAVHVNIKIMRTFVRLRQMLAPNAALARKLEALEKKYDAQFKVVFDVIRQLMTPPEPKRRKIGFLVKEKAAKYSIVGPPMLDFIQPEHAHDPRTQSNYFFWPTITIHDL